MEDEANLPFKEGQLAEFKSFLEGYRGAWFRCKIKNISRRKGRLGHVLEYLDFPDEELKWTRLYEVNFHHEGVTKGKHRELMLRPRYPPIYNEKKKPHVSEISEVAVIVGDSWRVGDLVDWFTTGCYWSGTIIELLGPNKAEVQLKPPPLGEGSSYKVYFKDLRPSLDWSPEVGWTVPTQEGAVSPCARLIKPINQGRGAEGVRRSDGSVFPSLAPSNPAVSIEAKSRTETQTRRVSEKQKDKQERNAGQGAVDSRTNKKSQVVAESRRNGTEVKSRTTAMQTQKVSEKSEKLETSTSQGQGPVDSSSRKTSRAVADSRQNKLQKQKDRQEISTSQGPVNSQPRKTSGVVADSGQHGAVAGPAAEVAEEELNPDSCQEKYRSILNSKRSDTIEAVIMDLEEHVNKVKWLKKILRNGISSPDNERPQWTFSEPLTALETPK